MAAARVCDKTLKALCDLFFVVLIQIVYLISLIFIAIYGTQITMSCYQSRLEHDVNSHL